VTPTLFELLADQSADSWVAVWTFCVFAATVALAIIAVNQIGAARTENRKTQTLLACGQYDTNQVMFDAQKVLARAKVSGELQRDPRKFRLEIMTLLNFLDAIAIGVKQDLYVNDLAREHMGRIARRHIRDLIESDVLGKIDCRPEYFNDLVELDKRWQKEVSDARPEILAQPFAPLYQSVRYVLRRSGIRR
jgi:hypothetical protein